MKQQAPRSRPTNNQLLYKAYFRWEHYQQRSVRTDGLPRETEPCASVTTAFLKVLDVLQQVESMCQPRRNILQILANNTRRTKVLELSSGTHRIPDELRKHFLVDEAGARYSTNLDRNRYGPDNNYLFTVIKNDLEALGLCTNLVEIEIIDSKAHAGAQLVSANDDACQCGKIHAKAPARPTPSGPNGPLFDMLLAAAADASAQDEQEEAERTAEMAASRPGPGTAAAAARDAALQRRRAPRRTPTGMFSLHSSDLMGLSNLGNSGVAVNDMDLDLKNEVEQTPSKRRRTAAAAMHAGGAPGGGGGGGGGGDDVSEQGDTERMLNGMGDGAEAAPRRRAPPAREESIVIANHGVPTLSQLNALQAEVRHLQHGQQSMRRILDSEREAYGAWQGSMRQTQDRVGNMQNALTQLHSGLQDVQRRLDVLEASAKPAADVTRVLQSVLTGLLTGDTDHGVLLQRLRGVASEGPPREGRRAGATVRGDEAVVSRQGGRGGGEASRGAAGGDGGATDASSLGMDVAARGADAAASQPMSMPPTAPGVTVLPSAQVLPASLNRLSHAPPTSNVETSLAPIPHLKHTGSSLAPAAVNHNVSTLSGLNAIGATEARSTELPDAPSQIDLNQRIEDTQMMRNLPVFDKFESISDFGSLFSMGGAGGKSEQVGAARQGGTRAPPRATTSITSRAPLMVSNTSEEQPQAQAA